MTTRREFFVKSFLTFAAAALAGAKSVSAAGTPYTGIIYTKDNPGKWKAKVASHAPQIKFEGSKVTITTDHGMKPKHYIVRHTLVLEDGKVVGSKTFDIATDTKAMSIFELPKGYKAKLYATSFCNLHDLWLTEVNL